MRALVISNCVVGTFTDGLQKLFPDWEVRGVIAHQAEKWLDAGDQPEFESYLAACDLYVGEPIEGRRYGGRIRPAADKIIIPHIHFRGLHPDIVSLPGFWGPLTVTVINSQCSLVALAACALNMNAGDTEAMFCADIYREFGFFEIYGAEKERILGQFAKFDIDLSEDFTRWEAIGDFFYVCHHPRAVVMIDILRRALLGKYLDPAAFAASAELARTQTDYLGSMEVWPVYPELAGRLGFGGGLTWVRPSHPREHLSLSEFVEVTFSGLNAMTEDWKHSYVVRAASMMKGYLDNRSKDLS